MRLTRLLKKDVDELIEAEARWWMGSRRKHPLAMTAVDLAVLGVMVTLAWIFIGPTYGALGLAATLALLGYGAFTVWGRRRRTPL